MAELIRKISIFNISLFLDIMYAYIAFDPLVCLKKKLLKILDS